MPAETSSVTVEPGFELHAGRRLLADQRSRRHLGADLRLLVRLQSGAPEGVDRVAELETGHRGARRPASAASRPASARCAVCVVVVDVDVGRRDDQRRRQRDGDGAPARHAGAGKRHLAGDRRPAEPCEVTWPSWSPAARSFATARSTVSPTIVGTSRPARPTASVRATAVPGATSVPARGDCAITLPGLEPACASADAPSPCARPALLEAGRRDGERLAALHVGDGDPRKRRAGAFEPPPCVSTKTSAIRGRIGSAAAHSGSRGRCRKTASKRSSRAPGTRGVATISMV